MHRPLSSCATHLHFRLSFQSYCIRSCPLLSSHIFLDLPFSLSLHLNSYHLIGGIQWNLTIKVTHGTGDKSDLSGEVTLLQGVICTVEYILGLSQGDCNGEVFLLVR